MSTETPSAGMVTLPVRVACGNELIMDAEIQVPVVAVVGQDAAGVQVQVSADMPGLRNALARFFDRAAEAVESEEITNPVDCHTTFTGPSPTPLERLVDSVVNVGGQQ